MNTLPNTSLAFFLVFIFAPCEIPAQSSVEVVRVVTQEVVLGQRIVGTVQPMRISIIGSALDGRVQHFDLDAGEAVKEGQRLAQLRTETLEIQLAAARAELELAEHQLAELKNGALPEDIAEAEAKMMGAKATMAYAETKYKRFMELSASRAASADELEIAKEQAEASRYAWMASSALLKRITDGPRTELISQARARVDLQSHQVQLLVDQINKLSIVSPFEGYVSKEFTEVGSWISRGDPIAEVVELKEVEVEMPVPVQYAVNVHVGDEMRVEFPELPNRLFVGVVDRIVPVAESRARTFPIFVKMPNQFEKNRPVLMAGMLARVELPADRRETMPLVPKDSLVLNGSRRSVFVIDQPSKKSERESSMDTVREVFVDLGVAWEGLIQVRGDLKENDLVVVTGNERLQSGAAVNVIQIADAPLSVSPELSSD